MKRNSSSSAKVSGAADSQNILGSQWGVRLNHRENRVLQRLRTGQVAKQIAAAENLSLRTVRWYMERLRNKFGVQSTLELLQKVGFLDPKSVI